MYTLHNLHDMASIRIGRLPRKHFYRVHSKYEQGGSRQNIFSDRNIQKRHFNVIFYIRMQILIQKNLKYSHVIRKTRYCDTVQWLSLALTQNVTSVNDLYLVLKNGLIFNPRSCLKKTPVKNTFGSFLPIHKKSFQIQFVLKDSSFEFELDEDEFQFRWFIIKLSK